MKIAAGVEALELTVNLMGRQSTIYLTVFWDEESVILVDAGYPGLAGQLGEAIQKAGLPLEKLNKVILTHQDIDHVGGLPEILGNSQQKIEVLAHEAEKPYIQGDKPLIKAEAAKNLKLSETLSEEQRRRLQGIFSNPPKAPVDKTIADGEELPYCGGIIVIYTPGHTPGHICLYHKLSKTLVTGDALTANDGVLSGPNPAATHDLEEAIKSVKKLAQYEIETIICYHGGVIKEEAQKQILRLVR